jgi:wyosine [tRNA(Phe)-imidazoG37] synthetase (radical SAM superfamily)
MTPSRVLLSKKAGHDLVDGCVYGPVRSRRLGWSLGINWFAPKTKVCNFDCVYCQLGPTDRLPLRADFVPLEVFAQEVETAFARIAADGTPIDVITISGNGEPTLHPRTPDLIDRVLAARDRYFPTARTWVLTNGTRNHVDAVAEALNRLDERAVKLDAVGPWLTDIDKPLFGFRWDAFVEGLRKLRDYHLQVMVVKGRGQNQDPRAWTAWVEWVRSQALRPKSIQLYTVDRFPAYAGVEPLDRREMAEVASYLSHRLPNIALEIVWPEGA